MTSYTATVLHGEKSLKIETRTIAPLGPGEATVEVMATGLCGSDLHYYTHGRNGDFVVQSPMSLGHEAGGRIHALPEGYHGSLKVGDRVAIEAGVWCKECDYCKRGKYNLCKQMSFASSAKTFPHRDGTMQQYMNHPVTNLYKLRPDVSYELAALAEPLSVVLNAARRVQLLPGQSVLVIGAGAVGLLACALAKAMGAGPIVAVDIDEAKLAFAKKQGWAAVTQTLPRGARVSGADALEVAKVNAKGILEDKDILELGSGVEDGFDVVFECSGIEMSMQTAILCARSGGTVGFVGMGTTAGLLPCSNAFTREVNLIGVFRYANTYAPALSMLASGALAGVENMVTQRYKLEDAEKAFEAMIRGKDEQGNMVVKPMVGLY